MLASLVVSAYNHLKSRNPNKYQVNIIINRAWNIDSNLERIVLICILLAVLSIF